MIGLDTNVLVRYIMQDDEQQSLIATRVIESLSAQAPGFVPTVVVVELGWVLSSLYELSRAQLVEAIEALLRTRELVLEHAELTWKALRLFQRARGDFSDCLIACAAASAGCGKTVTFDRGAAKNCGMTLLS